MCVTVEVVVSEKKILIYNIENIYGVLDRQLCCIKSKYILFCKGTVYQTAPANFHLCNHCCFTHFVYNIHCLKYETYHRWCHPSD
jgi:hypothetical protein